MRLTNNQIYELKELAKKGKTIKELKELFPVCNSTIFYHINEKTNKIQKERAINTYKKLTKEQRHNIYLRKKEYQKTYFKNRYHTDEEFRRSIIEATKRYQRRKKLK
jgi:uncharacterized membrane protein YgaE (UPF0421/DUF939 family)